MFLRAADGVTFETDLELELVQTATLTLKTPDEPIILQGGIATFGIPIEVSQGLLSTTDSNQLIAAIFAEANQSLSPVYESTIAVRRLNQTHLEFDSPEGMPSGKLILKVKQSIDRSYSNGLEFTVVKARI